MAKISHWTGNPPRERKRLIGAVQLVAMKQPLLYIRPELRDEVPSCESRQRQAECLCCYSNICARTRIVGHSQDRCQCMPHCGRIVEALGTIMQSGHKHSLGRVRRMLPSQTRDLVRCSRCRDWSFPGRAWECGGEGRSHEGGGHARRFRGSRLDDPTPHCGGNLHHLRRPRRC